MKLKAIKHLITFWCSTSKVSRNNSLLFNTRYKTHFIRSLKYYIHKFEVYEMLYVQYILLLHVTAIVFITTLRFPFSV